MTKVELGAKYFLRLLLHGIYFSSNASEGNSFFLNKMSKTFNLRFYTVKGRDFQPILRLMLKL